MKRFMKTHQTAALLAGLALALPLTLGAADVHAQSTSRNTQASQARGNRSEFTRLLNERAQLYRELRQLDQQAAQAVMEGEEPLTLYARQTGVQEHLDLVELRLQILATRHGYDLPSVEEQINDHDGDGLSDPRDEQARAFMNVGVNRTQAELRVQTARLLESIDFSDFVTPVYADVDSAD